MNVAELKNKLQKRGLSLSCNQVPLKNRLSHALTTGTEIRANTCVYPNPEDRFTSTAHWVEIHHNARPVENTTTDEFYTPINRDAV